MYTGILFCFALCTAKADFLFEINPTILASNSPLEIASIID